MVSPALAMRAATDVTRAPRLSLLWAIAFAGCAAAGSTVAAALASDGLPEPVMRAVIVDWIVLPYNFAGLVAWWRRPESRFGPLMVAAGFANFISTLSWASADVPYTIGFALGVVAPLLFL